MSGTHAENASYCMVDRRATSLLDDTWEFDGGVWVKR